MTRNMVACFSLWFSDSLMNMRVHLHILSCFWRRYRENTVCVVWSVYWLLSSYIIDMKSWNCFLCTDTVLTQIQTPEQNRFWSEYVLPGFCCWAIPPHKFPFFFCMSRRCLWEHRCHLPRKIWSTPILAVSGCILNSYNCQCFFYYCSGRPQEPLIGV